MHFIALLLTAAAAISASVADNSEQDVTPVVPESHIDGALSAAKREIQLELANYNVDNPAFHTNASRFSKTPIAPEVLRLEERHRILDRAAEKVSESYNIDYRTARSVIQERAAPHPDFSADFLCQRPNLRCDFNSKYRNIDGTCNNPRNPTWGRSIIPFDRLLAPAYGGGNGEIRRSVTGDDLPSARVVSSNCHPDINRPNPSVTHMLMGFGQFLNHDMTSTPDCQTPQCCQTNDRECLPIRFPNTDPVYSQFGITCIDFCRSIRACNSQSLVSIVGYGSGIVRCHRSHRLLSLETYGVIEEAASEKGQLKFGTNSRMLPQDRQNANCGVPQRGIFCFTAGDDRVNENPMLVAMHTLFFREHNRIARGLQSLNPRWNDQLLYLEAKRIVAAELQNIVYNEFLPIVLGPNEMNRHNLNLPRSGYSSYSVTTSPNLWNEFSTASYRFGHTMIQNFFNLFRNGNFPLSTSFQNPEVIYRQSDNVDRIVLGMTEQPAQGYENFMAEAVTSHLFQKPGAQIGTDLASLNINRGRDHGIPTWVHFRDFCQLLRPTTFDEMLDNNIMFSQDTVDSFFNTYAHIDDIDLWSAGISELPINGAVVGPTFACILSRQFNRLMYGDRFFLTHGGESGSFSSDQLANLRQRTLASVISDNVDLASSTQLQRNVFMPKTARNPAIPCANQPKLNLNLWKA